MSAELAIVVRPDADQQAEWTRAAQGKPLDEWLADLAQAAAIEDAVGREKRWTWPLVVKLQHPVRHGGVELTEITMRRGRIGDMKGLRISSPMPVELFVTCASRMCGQPTQVIEALDVDDAAEIMERARDFLERALGAGAG